MNDSLPCPKCGSQYTYEQDHLQVCSQCFHEFDPNEMPLDENQIKDAFGNILQNGDTVMVIKDLPVKGAQKPIRSGTKVKNIKLKPDNDHNIDCRIEGFGAVALKSEFVKKVL